MTAGLSARPTLPLSRRARQVVLVAHIAASVGWLGVDVVLLVLSVTGLTTGDPALMVGVYQAIGVLVPLVLVPATLAALGTGILLGTGTRWGLLRHWWVVAKLVLTVGLTVAVYVALRPGVAELATAAASPGPGGLVHAVGDGPRELIFGPTVSLVVLLVATTLSVLKPWGRTPRASRRVPRENHTNAP